QQEKNSAALVIVEDMIADREPPAGAYVLHARLLLRAGEPQRAAHQYREAIEIDAAAADAELARELGVTFGGSAFGGGGEGEVDGGGGQRAGDLPPGPPELDVERPSVTFQQVGGMDSVKEEIRMKIILPLEHPELFQAYGKQVGGGILMYGPPGCGKTYLARATDGEVKAGFLSVGINEALEMWIGQSERNLHEIFEQDRSHNPCVLFFDEFDASR